jgi:hypothetical protein
VGDDMLSAEQERGREHSKQRNAPGLALDVIVIGFQLYGRSSRDAEKERWQPTRISSTSPSIVERRISGTFQQFEWSNKENQECPQIPGSWLPLRIRSNMGAGKLLCFWGKSA